MGRRYRHLVSVIWVIAAFACVQCGRQGGSAPTTPTNNTGGGASFDSPLGIFTASGATTSTNNPVNDANVEGALVRADWTQIETAPGVFDWSFLDKQIDSVECNANCYSGFNNGVCNNSLSNDGRGGTCSPKNWSLAVRGGLNSPTWLYTGAGNLGVQTFAITAGTIPKFWDTTLQQRLSLLATAMAQRYGSDPALKLVYVTQMTENGVEGQFNGVSDSTLTNAGLTIDSWVSSVESIAQAFAGAFSKKSIAIELHYLLTSSCAGLRIMNDLVSQSKVAQIGVATWWFNGATNYQGDLIQGTSFGDSQDKIGTTEAGDPTDSFGRACTGKSVMSGGFQGFIAAGGKVFAQVIQQSSQTSSFPSGYANIFTQAEQLGIKYIEVWQQDVGTTWESNFSSFNGYAL